MKTIILEGPDGAGKSTLVEILKNMDPTIETIHPGKPAENYEALLAMMNDQLTYKTDNMLVYDRFTCLSEWVYRPFRIKLTDDSENEVAVYFSLVECQMVLSIHSDWTIIYCRPSIETMVCNSLQFTEHDTEDTKRVVEQHMEATITAYDALMDRLKSFGCNIVKFDYENHDVNELAKALLER